MTPAIDTRGDAARRLVYVDSFGDGHHVALHARAILRAAIAAGWQCLWLTSDHALEHPASRQLTAELGERLTIQVADFPVVPRNFRRAGRWAWYEVRHFMGLRSGLRSLPSSWRGSVAYLAWLDHCPRVIGAVGLPFPGFKYFGLHMHVGLHERPAVAPGSSARVRARGVSESLVRRMYAREGLSHIAVLIRAFAEFARGTAMPGWERVVYVPDLAQMGNRADRVSSRARLGAGEEDFVLLLYGALSLRKGVAELIETMTRLPQPERWILMLAGSRDAESTRLLEQKRQILVQRGIRLVEWNRFLNDEEESVAFAAADAVWMGYRGFFASSGVLLQSAIAGLPVVATHEGVIGETTRQWDLGPVLDVSDTAAVAEALERLRTLPELRREYGRHGERLADEHSPSRFASRILDLASQAA